MLSFQRKGIVVAGIALVALVLAPSVATAAGVAPSQATPVQREQAQARFLRGKEKLTKGQREAALAEFMASLDIVASPNTRLYVARSLREMSHLVAAYVELGRTEVEAKELARDDPRYEKTAQAAHDERLKLEPQLGFLSIEVTHAEPSTTIKVEGDEIRRGGWNEPVPVMPGSATVVVETPGRASIQRSVKVTAGEKASVAINAAEGAAVTAPTPPRPAASSTTSSSSHGALRNIAYVAGGAAVVGLGIFAFFGLKANGTYADLEKACNQGPCPPGLDAKISEGRTQQTTANMGLVVFVVGAATGVTLWVMGAPKSSPTAPSARLDAGPSFVGLRGAF